MRRLQDAAEVAEQPFVSTAPLVGGLIVRIRTAWNNMAGRWYVLAMFRQQNRFNQLAAAQLEEQEERLVAQDHDLTALTHTVAELELQLKQLAQRVRALEARHPADDAPP